MRDRSEPMWVFAHRGAAATRAEENTLGAFAAALARGAHLESDARVSRDGVTMLIHDSWSPTRLRVPMPVRWRSARSLARRGAVPIGRFYTVFAAELCGELPAGARQFSVDLKVAAAGRPMIAAAHRCGAAINRLWLVSDRLDLLRELRELDADVRLVHESRHDEIGDPFAHATVLAAAGMSAMNSAVASWTPELVAHVQGLGLGAFGSLVNDAPTVAAAERLGLDAIYTDHLELTHLESTPR